MHSMDSYKRNVPLLAISQALMLSSMSLILTVSALVGYQLTPDKSLATLPIAVIFIAVMITSIPAAMLMERIGRKKGFMFATLFGMSGGALATYAVVIHNFWIFTVSGLLIGIFNGFGNYFRFAAADAVTAEFKSRAISSVLIGGVVAAFFGPNLANLTRNSIIEFPFAGCYVSVAILYVMMFFVLSFLKLPIPVKNIEKNVKKLGRPLIEIAAQPRFIVAILCAMLGYGVMSFVMTATPLAMNHHAHTISDTSFVIQWHVLGMFAPSFVTGHLIHRFGVLKIMFVGGILGFTCVGINLLGTSVAHYWIALTALGISWNFLFIGGTTLLTETYQPDERSKTQAMNDFIIFTTVTISSLTAGTLQHQFGWQVVNMGVIPLLAVIIISVIWLGMKEKNKALNLVNSS